MNDPTFPPSTPPLPQGSFGPPERTSAMAITSLVFGILSLCIGIFALIGLPLGITSLVKVKGSQGRLGGGGLAIAGIVTSGIGFVLICLQIGLFLPALAKARANAQMLKFQMQGRQLAESLILFTHENDGALPSAADWGQQLESQQYVNLTSELAIAPAGHTKLAFNAALDGVRLDDLAEPYLTVLLFETSLTGPDAGGPDDLTDATSSFNGAIIVFADGHVEIVDPQSARTMPSVAVWTPQLMSDGP